MGFDIAEIDVTPAEPIHAGEAFVIIYAATNNSSADDPGHSDHVQMWRSDGHVPLDVHVNADPTRVGEAYSKLVDVPALEAGFYDIMITLADGTGRGRSLHVQ